MPGGDSAADRGKQLRQQAAVARTARKAGEKVRRGQSETSFRKEARAWQAGSLGEERASRKLAMLRRHGFTTLDDVLLEPGKKWNLDHLVIGPAGVFFVDAKNWRGNITVRTGSVWRHWYAGPAQGRQSVKMDDEVAKVRGMASHASARLGTRVQPVIALAGAKSRHFEGVEKVAGVVLVSVDGLAPWLRDAPVVLAPELVTMNVQIAQRLFPPATPQKPREPWVDQMRG